MALDIGPWSISDPSDTPYGSTTDSLLDWDVYQTTPPSIEIQTEGDYTWQIPGSAGTGITMSAQVKMIDQSGGSADLVLSGDSFTNTTDSLTAGEDTWQELSVNVTPAVDEVITAIFRNLDGAGTAYLSDPSVI